MCTRVRAYIYRNVNIISITMQVSSFEEFFTTTSYVGSMNDKSYFLLSPYVILCMQNVQFSITKSYVNYARNIYSLNIFVRLKR